MDPEREKAEQGLVAVLNKSALATTQPGTAQRSTTRHRQEKGRQSDGVSEPACDVMYTDLLCIRAVSWYCVLGLCVRFLLYD